MIHRMKERPGLVHRTSRDGCSGTVNIVPGQVARSADFGFAATTFLRHQDRCRTVKCAGRRPGSGVEDVRRRGTAARSIKRSIGLGSTSWTVRSNRCCKGCFERRQRSGCIDGTSSLPGTRIVLFVSRAGRTTNIYTRGVGAAAQRGGPTFRASLRCARIRRMNRNCRYYIVRRAER